MTRFVKLITKSDNDTVYAKVYVFDSKVYAGGKCIGQEYFCRWADSLEARFQKAHKWADEHIKVCEQYWCEGSDND